MKIKELGIFIVAAFGISSAWAACVGATCVGRDPQTEGCGTGTEYSKTGVYDDAGRKIGTVSVKWSKQCKANWALAQTDYLQGVYGAPQILSVKIVNAKSLSDSQIYVSRGSPSKTASPMIAGANKCVYGEIVMQYYNGRGLTTKKTQRTTTVC